MRHVISFRMICGLPMFVVKFFEKAMIEKCAVLRKNEPLPMSCQNHLMNARLFKSQLQPTYGNKKLAERKSI